MWSSGGDVARLSQVEAGEIPFVSVLSERWNHFGHSLRERGLPRDA